MGDVTTNMPAANTCKFQRQGIQQMQVRFLSASLHWKNSRSLHCSVLLAYIILVCCLHMRSHANAPHFDSSLTLHLSLCLIRAAISRLPADARSFYYLYTLSGECLCSLYSMYTASGDQSRSIWVQFLSLRLVLTWVRSRLNMDRTETLSSFA